MILVDADACPVIRLIEQIAEKYSVPCILFCDTNHVLSSDYSEVKVIGAGMRDINWVGFYLLKDDTLILGPFQGKPACVEIKVGKGVCGTAVAEDCTMLVPDVHAFPGHIACDSASNSEIVVPIHCSGKVVGVLDIDSPCLHRFDDEDRHGLECLVHTLEGMLSESLLELC